MFKFATKTPLYLRQFVLLLHVFDDAVFLVNLDRANSAMEDFFSNELTTY